MISSMAGVSDTLAPECSAFHPTIYQPYGILHPLHLNSNVSLVLVARSVHFSPLPSKILSDHRWALFPKSTRNPFNGVSFKIFLGLPVTQSMIPFLRIYFPAPTTPSIPLLLLLRVSVKVL